MKIVKLKIENLSRACGLPISLKRGKLLSSKNVSFSPVQVRTFGAAKTYFKAKNAKTKIKNLYLMYRGIKLKKDAAVFRKNGLQYDITVIKPGLIENEFIKTIGHSHPKKARTKITYPEIYEVIKGKALFLFQETNPVGKNARIFLIKAAAGEKIIVPPGFGHISINIGNEPLILANIQSINFKSDYSFFKKHRGAGYYVTYNQPYKFLTEKNPNYKNNFLIKIIKPKNSFGFKMPLYKEFIKKPKKFDFLNNPEKYKNILTAKNLFTLR